MKRLSYFILAFAVMTFLAVPAWAQKGGQGGHHGKSSTHASAHHSKHSTTRSNAGGKTQGLERAEQVQEKNTKADANRGFTVAPGVEKAETKTGAKPVGKGKSAGATKGKKGAGKDEDESKD